MADPTNTTNTIGLVLGACAALASVVAYLFREWGKERKEMMTTISTLQADRVKDAQAIPGDLITLARESQKALSDNTETNKHLAAAITKLNGAVDGLPEEILESLKKKSGKA